MNIMRIFKNILTATVLVIMAVGLSSCYFRLSDDAKKQFKYDLRYRMHTAEGEVDTVTYNPGEFHSVCNKGGIDDVLVIQTENEFKVEVISYEMMTDSIRVTNKNGVLTYPSSCLCPVFERNHLYKIKQPANLRLQG